MVVGKWMSVCTPDTLVLFWIPFWYGYVRTISICMWFTTPHISSHKWSSHKFLAKCFLVASNYKLRTTAIPSCYFIVRKRLILLLEIENREMVCLWIILQKKVNYIVTWRKNAPPFSCVQSPTLYTPPNICHCWQHSKTFSQSYLPTQQEELFSFPAPEEKSTTFSEQSSYHDDDKTNDKN